MYGIKKEEIDQLANLTNEMQTKFGLPIIDLLRNIITRGEIQSAVGVEKQEE